jgi:glycosyltransferase involved in cell wall biosynthesis
VKILLLHNFYQQPGGEDAVVQQEKSLLTAKGHDVQLFTVDNDSIAGLWSRAHTALESIYSLSSRSKVREAIRGFAPELVHVHNFFPLLSPSVYDACERESVPVVQTLHNFRLICPNALLYRNGRPCELCVGHSVPWPGVLHACYRDSYLGSTALAAMISAHRFRSTWQEAVTYISVSEFSRNKLIAGGVRSERLFTKPNFVLADPCKGARTGGYALFVGRLSAEKGISTLLSAWARVGSRKLKIIGDGPLKAMIQRVTSSTIEFIGSQSSESVFDLMGDAAFLLFPSECYENFPRVIVEAFAKGLPVLASRIGSVEELVADGKTGLLFNFGDPDDLAAKAEWMFSHPEELSRMSLAARKEYEEKYTAERNYEQLMQIYRAAMENAAKRYSA